ncbi:MAG: hypothetical protein QOF94_490, partial [Acidobacteriaceae bacterium]
DIHAGCKAVLHQMARDFGGLSFRVRGGKDDSFVGHIKSAISNRQPSAGQRHLRA